MSYYRIDNFPYRRGAIAWADLERYCDSMWRNDHEHFRVIMRPEPPFIRSPKGALNHRTRWVVHTNSPSSYGWETEYRAWCGQRMWNSPDKPNNVQIVNPDYWVCHMCEDRAVFMGGQPTSNLIPQTGCEVSNGAYFRPARAHQKQSRHTPSS